jgi:hypothetical protein
MSGEVERTRAALRGTALAGLPIGEMPGDCLCIVGVEPRDVLSAWRAARAAMPVTGRRPVFRCSDDAYQREPTAVDLAELDVAARSIDPWSQAQGPWADEPMSVDELWLSVPVFEGADLLGDAVRHFDAPTSLSVDRWVYDRVIADPGLLAQAHAEAEHLVGTGWWRQPATVELWLLPTPHAHLAPAWVSYHGMLGEQEVLAAALLRWHQAWEAEPVAAWGLELQFSVGRRPALGDEAWDLAVQLKTFANHLESDHWMVALALTRSNEWYLYDRP